jgi:hypothetical protein
MWFHFQGAWGGAAWKFVESKTFLDDIVWITASIKATRGCPMVLGVIDILGVAALQCFHW